MDDNNETEGPAYLLDLAGSVFYFHRNVSISVKNFYDLQIQYKTFQIL